MKIIEIIETNDSIEAVILRHRVARGTYTAVNAGVIQLRAKDGGWTSQRIVTSLGGDNGDQTFEAGMPPVDRERLNAALRLAAFMAGDGSFEGSVINAAVASCFRHCVDDAEVSALLDEV